MSQAGPIDDLGDFAAVAKPAPGGTLKEYVAYEHAAGLRAFLAPDETHVWIQEARGVLGCFPLEYGGPLDARFMRHVLRQPGIWMLTYLVAGTESQPANCVDYVCRGPNYHLESLSPRARRVAEKLDHLDLALMCLVERYVDALLERDGLENWQ